MTRIIFKPSLRDPSHKWAPPVYEATGGHRFENNGVNRCFPAAKIKYKKQNNKYFQKFPCTVTENQKIMLYLYPDTKLLTR